MSAPPPAPRDPSSALAGYLASLAAVLIAALALTTIARSIVRVVDQARARIRTLWNSGAS